MSEVREWLRRHNLEQYADAFEANDIGIDILPELSERDLEQLGLSLGNRRRLLKAVAGRAAEAASPQQESPAQARQRPSVARSRCCSATWSVRRRYRTRLIPNCLAA
jgi:hypothetical protein